MTILTNLLFYNRNCRYYVCSSNFGKRPKCLQFISKKHYEYWCEKNKNKNNDIFNHITYCDQSNHLDTFRILMNSMNYQLPTIEQYNET